VADIELCPDRGTEGTDEIGLPSTRDKGHQEAKGEKALLPTNEGKITNVWRRRLQSSQPNVLGGFTRPQMLMTVVFQKLEGAQDEIDQDHVQDRSGNKAFVSDIIHLEAASLVSVLVN
jgi:hypothetical protein